MLYRLRAEPFWNFVSNMHFQERQERIPGQGDPIVSIGAAERTRCAGGAGADKRLPEASASNYARPLLSSGRRGCQNS